MNRRNFFKAVTGFVAGVLMSKKSVGQKRSGTRLITEKEICDWLGEPHTIIYRGFYFTEQEVFDSELRYLTLHPFFAIQGKLPMFILNDQFENRQIRYNFLDEMIRQWKKKQVYTTEELRGF